MVGVVAEMFLATPALGARKTFEALPRSVRKGFAFPEDLFEC